MISLLFALGHGASWTLESGLVAVVIIAAMIAVALIAIKAFGLAVPQWVVQIIVVCGATLLAVAAIRFLVTL